MWCVLRISVFFCATLGADAMQLAFAADCASLCHTLCNGISSIANSTPEQLRQPGAIAAIVRRVGLYSPIEGGHETFKEKYGEEYAKSVIKRGATRNGMASSPDQLHGMWQSPEQFECAMLHLSTLPIHSTLSIGTYSGWTDVLLHTVLRRFRPEQHLSSIITDQDRYFHQCVADILHALGTISFQRYTSATGPSGNAPGALGSVNGSFVQFGQSKYDLCIVDAAHSYRNAQEDVEKALAVCSYVMLHDIAQSSGVRPLWYALSNRTAVTHECIQQPTSSAKERASLSAAWNKERECVLGVLSAKGPPPTNRADRDRHWFKSACSLPSRLRQNLLMGIGIVHNAARQAL
jgi:BarA-like signal transduction histidine kinase